MSLESFPTPHEEDPQKEVFLGKLRSLPKKIKLVALGTALGVASCDTEKVQSNTTREDQGNQITKEVIADSMSMSLKDTAYYSNAVSLPIQKREDFDGNMMSGAGLGYAEFEAQAALSDFSKTPYGNLFDLYRYYFGQPLQSSILYNSQFTPNNAEDSGVTYVEIRDKGFLEDIMKEYELLKDQLPLGSTVAASGYSTMKHPKNTTTSAIGNFRIGHDIDEKGEYVSYYDLFDVGSGKEDSLLSSMQGGKSFEIYGRIYLNPEGLPVYE